MGTIEEQLFAIVQQEFGLEPNRITTATQLAELGDSLDWLSLLTALEDAFDIRISHERSLSLRTVDDLLHLVKEPALA